MVTKNAKNVFIPGSIGNGFFNDGVELFVGPDDQNLELVLKEFGGDQSPWEIVEDHLERYNPKPPRSCNNEYYCPKITSRRPKKTKKIEGTFAVPPENQAIQLPDTDIVENEDEHFATHSYSYEVLPTREPIGFGLRKRKFSCAKHRSLKRKKMASAQMVSAKR